MWAKGVLVFKATYPKALFWSNLVKAVIFFLFNFLHMEAKIQALVLAGLPTTTTLQSGLA